MLLIPTIEIKAGLVVPPDGGSVCLPDPVQLARLWRLQNARSLYVLDHDAQAGRPDVNAAVIRQLCEGLMIPIQLAGGFHTLSAIEAALALGAYRVVIDLTRAQPALVAEAIRRFTNRKIVPALTARHGVLLGPDGQPRPNFPDAITLANVLADAGCCRLIYTDLAEDGSLGKAQLDAIARLGEASPRRMKLTLGGGVCGYADLRQAQALKPYRVDSVVIGAPFYENQFPCQASWCWHRAKEIDTTEISTAQKRPPAA